MVRKEQACCDFLTFELDERPEELWLTVKAPAADALFGQFTASAVTTVNLHTDTAKSLMHRVLATERRLKPKHIAATRHHTGPGAKPTIWLPSNSAKLASFRPATRHLLRALSWLP